MDRICTKCQKEITDNSAYCPSCGGLVEDKEVHRVKSLQRKKIFGVIAAIAVVLCIALIIFFLVPFPYTAIEHYSIQEPYTDVEHYTEQVPYQSSESYKEQVGVTNCNSMSGCTCMHYSYLGLGPCDSCSCIKYRTVTSYQNVDKTRTVTKYRTIQQPER